ncbi:isoaspartyl peptidase/L-asparaginase [uncultured Pontibacter sp.]|uniref:isoaspartyl peptidase/L-asparaginase family protein n=1 Tax=uncultured Pontibacter sp. TaxID=453356 RepID=UPI00260E4057|nr:isoaspartyl peptidase/L-asparaginase [uncultured Pontibacter sp.]
MGKYAIAIHGGAGTISKSSLTPEKEKAFKDALEQAIMAGHGVLQQGGSALDAAEMAVMQLENSPLFNAGKGSVFTNDGKHEMDAAIMCGKTLEAGAVAGVRHIKNPIKLARKVKEESEYVLLAGQGAVEFALSQHIELASAEYFFDDYRYQQLLDARESGEVSLDHSEKKKQKFGTVGAVALDVNGNVAAATSTGGMTNKKYSRVGDTPLIGAGTYANNKTCAVSCTGHGEFFIRAVAAYDVSCLMEYKGYTLQQACDEVVLTKLQDIGGDGGLIAVNTDGEVVLSFNSDGMYRASKVNDEETFTAIYKEH